MPQLTSNNHKICKPSNLSSAPVSPLLARDHTAGKGEKEPNVPSLRVIAVAAPECLQGKKDNGALNSSDPVSLFNACRVAASKAVTGKSKWAESNWGTGGRARIRSNFLLMYSLDDVASFVELLEREKPNMLLLGAMTLCMPGAIECAKIARQKFGQDILIVLGGRHATETIYLRHSGARAPVDVLHHRGSPSRLIREAHIPPVFDVVVSGDGEYVIAELGEIVAHVAPPYHPQKIVGKLSTNTPGDWIVSLPEDCVEIVSAGHRIDPNGLPPLPGLFGVSASFDVFNGRMTAHVFSDIGRGCVYNCDFCSEKSSVTGPLNALPSAAKRLYRQLEDAVEIIQEDYPTLGASAFVEDSVLLGGSPKALDSLASMLEQQPLQIEFGAQLTIDQVLARGPQLARLAQVGLRYLFIGVETMDPNDFGGMSKDIGGKGGSWDSRTRHAFDLLQHHGIACGCSLLFGLGERHSSRVALLEMLINNRRKSGYPSVLSANWAVQHPLRGTCGDPGYNYVDWGTPIGPYIELFHHFGEASLLYPLSGQRAPAIHEIEEVVAKLTEFNTCICVPRSKHGSTIVDLSTTL